MNWHEGLTKQLIDCMFPDAKKVQRFLYNIRISILRRVMYSVFSVCDLFLPLGMPWLRVEFVKLSRWMLLLHSCYKYVEQGIFKDLFHINIQRFIYFTFIFREIAAASGEWVNEFIPNNGKKKTSAKLYVPSTAELLKRNIKRSWTISSKFLRKKTKTDCCNDKKEIQEK